MSVITPNSPSQRWLTPIIILMAVAAAAALGWAVISIASPAIITVVVVGLVLAVLTVVRAEFGLALLVLINYTRVSDTLIKYQGFPSVAKPLVALLVVTVLSHWVVYKEPPRGWDNSGNRSDHPVFPNIRFRPRKSENARESAGSGTAAG